MSNYTKEHINHIEKKWQKRWADNNVYKTVMDSAKPKYYVLDMFPYPSGAGLHVGHPLGYIASDILARYKRNKGFNVMHPMGFDAFGLPAEQYAIEHGIPPAISTKQNIASFRSQFDKIGFSYDWSRMVQTCDPTYYRWTQWIFLQFFDSWFHRTKQRAEHIRTLINIFEQEGNQNHPFPNRIYTLPNSTSRLFSKNDWLGYNKIIREQIIMEYRMAYLADTDVNWCKALGTVLANDEVINGVSYRGGHPVTKKKMRQWNLRITEYAERLLEGLNTVDFSPSMKEIQRNWIGKSCGMQLTFEVDGFQGEESRKIEVFTTHPETIYGVDFMVLAPEHPLIHLIATTDCIEDIKRYQDYIKTRSEIERMSKLKKITGCFIGRYAIHPLSKKKLPIWISEYILMNYGTGSIMGVPCSDERDHRFAKHFNLSITNILGNNYDGINSNNDPTIKLQNSDFLNGTTKDEAFLLIADKLEPLGLGQRRIHYKMRDAGWSRQRYWGEPFPVVYNQDMPQAIPEDELPLLLPNTQDFKSLGNGEGPLARLHDWIHLPNGLRRDSNTMPTHAGAAWYFLRYMDPHNTTTLADRKKTDYWNQVDVYVGGSEHAVAHLLYARLWVKLLFDLDYIGFDEPFKKLINQGKIMGESRFVYRIRGSNTFVSIGLKDQYETDPLRVDLALVDGITLDKERFKKWKPNFSDASFILEKGNYFCGKAIEKMSKSYFNTVNPDTIIDCYGADTLRMYEMFLGPLEQSKPWNTQGIEGVHKFLKRFQFLFYDTNGNINVSDTQATKEELKILHKTIYKIEEDMEHFSFNTSVSELMICVNALTSLSCNKRSILTPLTVVLAPFAPHLAQELWEQLGYSDFVIDACYPAYIKEHIQEDMFNYPVSINGKVRTKISFPLQTSQRHMEALTLQSEVVKKWIKGTPPKKIIIVLGKIINLVT